MDAQAISQLADILRRNGDKVLSGESKFTLSISLLNTVNNSFNLIIEQRDALNSSFQVLSNTNTGLEIFSDIQFLHDFVQRTVSLKLLTNIIRETSDVEVDVSSFRNLKLLELHKVHVGLVTGLQALRDRLQFLICVRSLNNLKDVLNTCGADKTLGNLWNELKEAVFSHNDLDALDDSLEFTPWLHTLDLSHNNLKSTELLNCLSNLKHLNLSYNKLEKVPEFTGQICSRLQVRIVKIHLQ